MPCFNMSAYFSSLAYAMHTHWTLMVCVSRTLHSTGIFCISCFRTKGKEALLLHPPQGDLTGWRDPFLVGGPSPLLFSLHFFCDQFEKVPSSLCRLATPTVQSF